MKKRIISIFLSVFIATLSSCAAAQSQQTAQTTAETTLSFVSATSTQTTTSEKTTESETKPTESKVGQEGSETTTTASETTAKTTNETTIEIPTETVSTTTEAETTTSEQTKADITSKKTTSEMTASETITTTTPATTTSAENTTTAKAAEKTKKTTAETAPPEMTEETQMTKPEQTEPKVIALTFDDGPNTTTTNEVLDVLEKYGIKASFFLIGNNIDSESAKSVKRAYDMGCEIGNHSKTHSYMDKMSVDEIVAEVEETNERIADIIGEEPKFFRPPYISFNKDMVDNIDMPFIAGYGANDWVDEYTAEHRAELVIRQARDGGIILLHDAKGNSQTVQALDIIIPELQSQGYEFVTISEVFARKGIAPEAHNGKIYSYAEQVGEYS